VPVTIGLAGVVLFLVNLAVRAQRSRPVTGTSGMLDEPGEALSAIAPGVPGRVRTHGEIWTATSHEPITPGEAVRVVAVSGLVLTVTPERQPSASASTRAGAGAIVS
jgi:membrane-bound serine protease (ClpP class)